MLGEASAPASMNGVSIGVEGFAYEGVGVLGISGNFSNTYRNLQPKSVTGGVWGDNEISTGVAGIMGTADNTSAGYFENNSQYVTIYAHNDQSGGPTGLFKVFKAETPAGVCGIGDGDLTCTGQLKSLATTGGGARTVETYATQSAENWMEDYGTGAIEHGVGVVHIDATFAETVTADTSYHVFLTPLGDSKGLYVVKTGATSFEVRESGGGTASIGFDYKVVAKRRGLEAQRLVDVTERLHVEQELAKRFAPVEGLPASKESDPRLQRNRPHPQVRPGGRTITPQAPKPPVAVTAPTAKSRQ